MLKHQHTLTNSKTSNKKLEAERAMNLLDKIIKASPFPSGSERETHDSSPPSEYFLGLFLRNLFSRSLFSVSFLGLFSRSLF